MLVKVQQIAIAGHDELGFGGRCAGKHVVILGIAAGGLWQGLRCDDFGQALDLRNLRW